MTSRPDTITEIAVRGFKSIADEQEIEVRPLTLLAGANSSGKSSIMQPVLLLKQTLEAPSDPGPLLLDGPNIRFTSAEQFLSKMPARARKSEFGVRISLSTGARLGVVYKRQKGAGLQLDTMDYANDGEKLRIVPGMSHDEIIKILPDPFKDLHADSARGRNEKLYWCVRRDRCFFSFTLAGRQKERPLGPIGVSPTGLFVHQL